MAEEILMLAQELAEITRLVEDDDVTSTLDRFVTRVVRTVPDVEEAAIFVLDEDQPRIVARHHRLADPLVEPVRAVLADQLSRPGSPLREALEYGEPRRVAEIAADHRWPEFTAAAINAGYRSCLFLPVPANGPTPAVFSLFSDRPAAFDTTSYDLALLFALHAGVAFDNVQLFHDSRALIEQLRLALVTRGVIGQAQGLLMQRFTVGSEIAFRVLQRCSQDRNIKLREIAADLVGAHERGDLTGTLMKYGLSTAS